MTGRRSVNGLGDPAARSKIESAASPTESEIAASALDEVGSRAWLTQRYGPANSNPYFECSAARARPSIHCLCNRSDGLYFSLDPRVSADL
jgi:hypothetical protein